MMSENATSDLFASETVYEKMISPAPTSHYEDTKLPYDIPNHKEILEMHANSESSALLYVIVVLALYVVALLLVLNRYLRTEHYESRLSRLYESFLRRDSFLTRWSKRRHQQPETETPTPPVVKTPKETMLVVEDEITGTESKV